MLQYSVTYFSQSNVPDCITPEKVTKSESLFMCLGFRSTFSIYTSYCCSYCYIYSYLDCCCWGCLFGCGSLFLMPYRIICLLLFIQILYSNYTTTTMYVCMHKCDIFYYSILDMSLRGSQSKPQPPAPVQPSKRQPLTSVVEQIKPFNVNDYAKDGISKDQVLQFKTAFDIFDGNGTGKAEIADIKEAFINLGFHHQSKFAEILLYQLEQRDEGVITFGEFIRLATARLDRTFTQSQTDLVFSAFDPKGNGKFNKYDLKDTARDLGEDLNDEQIDKIFKSADTNDDGYVTNEDFYNIVTKKTLQ